MNIVLIFYNINLQYIQYVFIQCGEPNNKPPIFGAIVYTIYTACFWSIWAWFCLLFFHCCISYACHVLRCFKIGIKLWISTFTTWSTCTTYALFWLRAGWQTGLAPSKEQRMAATTASRREEHILKKHADLIWSTSLKATKSNQVYNIVMIWYDMSSYHTIHVMSINKYIGLIWLDHICIFGFDCKLLNHTTSQCHYSHWQCFFLIAHVFLDLWPDSMYSKTQNEFHDVEA